MAQNKKTLDLAAGIDAAVKFKKKLDLVSGILSKAEQVFLEKYATTEIGTVSLADAIQEMRKSTTYSADTLLAEALVEPLGSLFPGMHVSMRLYMDLDDPDTLFYTSIFEWSLVNFAHHWVPNDLHLKNALENPDAVGGVIAQYAKWDVSFAEVHGHIQDWKRVQEATLRKQQEDLARMMPRPDDISQLQEELRRQLMDSANYPNKRLVPLQQPDREYWIYNPRNPHNYDTVREADVPRLEKLAKKF